MPRAFAWGGSRLEHYLLRIWLLFYLQDKNKNVNITLGTKRFIIETFIATLVIFHTSASNNQINYILLLFLRALLNRGSFFETCIVVSRRGLLIGFLGIRNSDIQQIVHVSCAFLRIVQRFLLL